MAAKEGARTLPIGRATRRLARGEASARGAARRRRRPQGRRRGGDSTMSMRECRRSLEPKAAREWVVFRGRPQPKPEDPRERWRREWLPAVR